MFVYGLTFSRNLTIIIQFPPLPLLIEPPGTGLLQKANDIVAIILCKVLCSYFIFSGWADERPKLNQERKNASAQRRYEQRRQGAAEASTGSAQPRRDSPDSAIAIPSSLPSLGRAMRRKASTAAPGAAPAKKMTKSAGIPTSSGTPSDSRDSIQPPIVCDPNGDVVLLVEYETRIRVSSETLSRASNVFAAMFSPRFSEGQDLRVDQPKEIGLPEDNGIGMVVLMQMLHNVPIRRFCCSKTFAELAVLANKYQCCGEVLQSPALWHVSIERKLIDWAQPDWRNKAMDYFVASYLLKLHATFEDMSRDLVHRTDARGENNMFLLRSACDYADLLPTDIFG